MKLVNRVGWVVLTYFLLLGSASADMRSPFGPGSELVGVDIAKRALPLVDPQEQLNSKEAVVFEESDDWGGEGFESLSPYLGAEASGAIAVQVEVVN